MAEELTDDWWVMPYGHEIGKADDHMHLDLGYVVVVPREMSEDRLEAPQPVPASRLRGAPQRGSPRLARLDSPSSSRRA